MTVLIENKTWDIATLPEGKKVVGCKWIFMTKLAADGKMDRIQGKAAQGCIQTRGIDYQCRIESRFQKWYKEVEDWILYPYSVVSKKHDPWYLFRWNHVYCHIEMMLLRMQLVLYKTKLVSLYVVDCLCVVHTCT